MPEVVAFKVEKTSDNGVPDIFFCSLRSGAIFLEVKDVGKKPKPHQQAMINRLNAAGVKAFYVDSIEGWIRLRSLLFN